MSSRQNVSESGHPSSARNVQFHKTALGELFNEVYTLMTPIPLFSEE